jgi:arylsulfatase A
MIRCQCLQTVVILTVMFARVGWAAGSAIEQKPNIIYIMLDEWGYFEWSAMGHPILKTPHIDKVASEGMRFTQFLSGGNVCAPTRSVLMTGLHTGHTTVRTNGGALALCADDITIASVLKDAGYATGGFGKWGLGDAGTTGVPENHGFDTFFGYYHQVHAHTYYPRYLLRNSKKVPLKGNTGEYLTGETFSHYLIHAEGMKFIRANKDRPFFAYLPWTPPHGLWGMPEDEPAWQKYKNQDWDAKNQRGEQDAEMYAAMVEMVDRQLGEILALLAELKIDDKTVVIVCGDNGGQPYFQNANHPHGYLAPNLNPRTGVRFRGGKGNFYEGGLRIPFMVRWPGRIKAGAVSDYLGYFPDIMPTLAELAGVDLKNDTDGFSIVPTLLGGRAGGRRQKQHPYLYWEDSRSKAVRMGDWKAIQPSKSKVFELYDLTRDIEEKNNVADKYPDILQKMTAYAQQAHTPRRNGKVLDASVGFKGHKAD